MDQDLRNVAAMSRGLDAIFAPMNAALDRAAQSDDRDCPHCPHHGATGCKKWTCIHDMPAPKTTRTIDGSVDVHLDDAVMECSLDPDDGGPYMRLCFRFLSVAYEIDYNDLPKNICDRFERYCAYIPREKE